MVNFSKSETSNSYYTIFLEPFRDTSFFIEKDLEFELMFRLLPEWFAFLLAMAMKIWKLESNYEQLSWNSSRLADSPVAKKFL